uniref:Uncharacterized protein n=1 Tax=Caulobacter phage BL57 TaxID=3348355 RepID=A0AB74UMR1_9VIRU
MEDKWNEVTPAQVEDQLSALCHELSKRSGVTLAPATFYERAKLTITDLPAIPEAEWNNLQESTRKSLLAMQDRFSVHGSGFMIYWNRVKQEEA